jgi:hypothetical protein
MFSSACVVLALAASAFGTVFITSPTASTTFTGGQQAEVSWIDDGTAPSLQSFGPASVSIYAGNAQQQTLLQSIVGNVNVATTSSVQFTPNPTIGPNSNEYFIRIQSLSLPDPTQPQYPALAFSSKFTMAGMTGTFNASVQAQIDGQSTAPIGGTTTSSGPTSHLPGLTSTGSASHAASASATVSAPKPTNTSGASSLAVPSVFGALVGIVAFFGIAL